MKIRLLSLACVALLAASCSAPKMAYKFDYHDYNAGRKTKDVKQEVAANPGPTPVQPETLVAVETTTAAPVTSIESNERSVVVAEGKTYENMTKKERRAFVKEVKKEIKKIVKKKDNVQEAQGAKAIDRDLKLASIFGAVGIVGLILGGVSTAFWVIGAIALIIGVVFFVKWLIRQ